MVSLDRINRHNRKERSAAKMVIFTEGDVTEPQYLADWIKQFATKNSINPIKANMKFEIVASKYESEPLKIVENLIEAKNPGTSVQGEIIVRQLIRDANNILHRPDFSRIIMRKGYEIMTVNTALRKHPSITTSMSTPYLRYQLISQMETFEKTETSDKDAAFREVLTDLAYPVIKEY